MNKIENRLCSLDVFRGFTIAGMMIVNNPGSWDYVYAPFRHAVWHGCTFADLIFPFFIWIVGVAMVFSFAKNIDQGISRSTLLKKALIRSVLLFAVGLFVNSFPFGLGLVHDFSWATIRVPGVLQRIAVCYFLTSVIVLYSKKNWQVFWIITLFAFYWILLKFIPVPGFGAGILEPIGNWVWYIDTNLLQGHILKSKIVLGPDPEGILSTIPAIATMLLGVLTGYLLQFKNISNVKKSIYMLLCGGVFILFGLVMNHWLPINKDLWTPSFAIFVSGVALVIFSCCCWMVDIKGYKKIFKPLQIMGINALFLYVVSILIIRLNYNILVIADKTPVIFKNHYYQKMFFIIEDPMISSLAHSVVFMLFMYLIAYLLYRKRLVIAA